jgi:hypothetical protein
VREGTNSTDDFKLTESNATLFTPVFFLVWGMRRDENKRAAGRVPETREEKENRPKEKIYMGREEIRGEETRRKAKRSANPGGGNTRTVPARGL